MILTVWALARSVASVVLESCIHVPVRSGAGASSRLRSWPGRSPCESAVTLVLETGESEGSIEALASSGRSGPCTSTPRSRQPVVTPSPSYSGAMLKPPMNAVPSSAHQQLAVVPVGNATYLQRIEPPKLPAHLRQRSPKAGRPTRTNRRRPGAPAHRHRAWRRASGFAELISRRTAGVDVHLQPNGSPGGLDGCQHRGKGVLARTQPSNRSGRRSLDWGDATIPPVYANADHFCSMAAFGQGRLPAMLAAIEAAGDSVRLEMYIYSSSAPGRSVPRSPDARRQARCLCAGAPGRRRFVRVVGQLLETLTEWAGSFGGSIR